MTRSGEGGGRADGRAAAAFVTCAAIWGSTFLFIRLGEDALPPLWSATLRLALATVLLTGVVFATGRRPPRGAAFRSAAAFGALNFGLSFPLLYRGELHVPTGTTSVFFATIPLTTSVLAHAAGLERATRPRVTGAAIALAGVAVLFSGGVRAAVPAGSLLEVFGAATLAAAAGIVLKRGPRQDPVGANAVGAAAGCVLCAAASALAGEPRAVPWTLAALGPVVYLAVAGSAGAFVLYAWLLNRWPVSRASFVSVTTPVVATALGALVRHEPLTAVSLGGSALVLAGVAMGLRAPR